MDIFEMQRRLEMLERKMALMEGREDPGLTCRGDEGNEKQCVERYGSFPHCHNGKFRYWGGTIREIDCKICGGTGRIYPEIEAGLKGKVGVEG